MSRRIRSSSSKSARKEQMVAIENEIYPATETRVNKDRKRNVDENIRIEVLEEKIKIDSKNHEKEKRKITSEKDEAVSSLEAENEHLKIEVANKNDKIRQLDIANGKKEFLLKKNDQKIKELRKERDEFKQRADDLQREISRLEDTSREMSEKFKETTTTVEKQQEEITMMKVKIDDLKEELALVRAERDARDALEEQLLSQMKSMETKMEEINRNAKAREKEQERRMDEREKKRDEEAKRRERLLNEEWERREAKQEEDARRNNQRMHDQFERVIGEVFNIKTEVKREIREHSKPKNDGFVITESKNLQVQSGNHFYMGPTSPSRKKTESFFRGKVQPQTRFSFPSSIGVSLPRSGINNKMTIYK